VETIGFWWKVNSDRALAEQLHKLFAWLYFEYENGRRTDTRLLAFTGTPSRLGYLLALHQSITYVLILQPEI
jgi:hypothetical protein